MIFIKTPEDIEKIREACKIVEKILLNIEKEIKTGITTKKLDTIAEELIVSLGGSPAFKGYRGFRHATCISINSEVVHGLPSDVELMEGDISYAIEKVATDAGFSVVKDLFGHGIGRSLHEDPLIPNFGVSGTGVKLKKGMVLAIEPMLNIGASQVETLDDGWTVVTADRTLSAHFEDTILITENEPEILTRGKYNGK